MDIPKWVREMAQQELEERRKEERRDWERAQEDAQYDRLMDLMETARLSAIAPIRATS